MPFNPRKILAAITGTASVASIGYATLALARTRAFVQRPRSTTAFMPSLTVLKPICGDEPCLYENLRSFCEQQYPSFQILFGVRADGDPAIPVVRAVMQRFPNVDAQLIITESAPQLANPKIANLGGLLPHAKYDLLVIADSDIRVERQYLAAVARCFSDPQVGAATCLYGATGNGLAGILGAMQVNEHFAPSVLVALAFQSLSFCLGATMAVRRDVLNAIGGLEAIGAHIADDYMLGKLVAEAGFRVALCEEIVRTTVSDATLADLWAHELRWARTIRRARPAGYAGSILTYAIPLALAHVLVAQNRRALTALAIATGLRVALHDDARAVFAPQQARTPWLIPLRDVLACSLWACGLFGERALWRGDEIALGDRGEIAQSSTPLAR